LRELFGNSDYIESQRFNKLNRLPIGLDHDDLETTLREGDLTLTTLTVMGGRHFVWPRPEVVLKKFACCSITAHLSMQA
jgi:hypothetical protein